MGMRTRPCYLQDCKITLASWLLCYLEIISSMDEHGLNPVLCCFDQTGGFHYRHLNKPCHLFFDDYGLGAGRQT